ncbi:hypothetical protein B296_00025869 [Ensete ventricosum]|uniref:Retrotransposon gag domain-containing protein n=1 Tax=Ensete ventricosum TaxID=4639 RepID=A0A426XAI3_ENSVE|nr:hypothetical protein B296_00025869 [Ensete ventricosum]
MSQERPTSNPNAEHPGGSIHVFPPTSQSPLSLASLNWPRHQPTNFRTSLGRQCGRKHPNQGRPKGNTPEEHPAHRSRPPSRTPTSRFRLPALESYGGSTDLTEHGTAFRAQMALYDTSDALMCYTFPTTLRGSAQMWYSRIKPFFISSFDQFAKEFERNFIASSYLRPTIASLLGLTQGNDEPLAQFVSIFSGEIRRMPDTHPTLAIQAFLMGLWPSRFFWSLIERPLSTVPEITKVGSRDKRRYYHFHRDYGHDTEECNDLRNQIEDLIRQEHLHRFIQDRRASEERPHRDKNPSPRPDRSIEKQIDVIVSSSTSGGDSSSARKSYARPAVEKRSRRSQDPRITFGEGDDVYSNHDDALVISAQIANARVKRVMMGTGIPDQGRGRRSLKRPPGIQAVLSDSNHASKKT